MILQFLKAVFFIITAPFLLGLSLLFEFVYGTVEKQGWFQLVWTKEGKYMQKTVAIILAPFFITLGGFMFLVFKTWDKAMDSPFG